MEGLQAMALETADELKIVSVDHVRAIATYNNVSIVIWRGTPRVEDMQDVKRCMTQLIAERGKIAHLNVVEAGSPKPAPEVQAASMEMIKAVTKEHVVGWSFVVEDATFLMMLFRVFLAGLRLTQRIVIESTSHLTIKDGAEWLEGQLRASKLNSRGSIALTSATHRLRRQLDKHAPSPRLAV